VALTEAARAWLTDNAENGSVHLAEMLSLAAIADPWLVRETRLWLRLPVTAEVDVWFSPLVSSATTSGVTFTIGALEELRRRLSQAPERLAQAWAFTARRHPSLAPAVREEERLTYAAVSGDPSAAGAAEQLFNRALVAVVRDRSRSSPRGRPAPFRGCRRRFAGDAAPAISRRPPSPTGTSCRRTSGRQERRHRG
jgi:hypothetical protein